MFDDLASWFRGKTVAALDVVGLESQDTSTAAPGWRWPCRETWVRTLDADARAAILSLIAAVPPGDVARCHAPAYGLRVTTEAGPVNVSLCFRCDNAYVGAELRSLVGSSIAGRALLEYLRGLRPAGHADDGE